MPNRPKRYRQRINITLPPDVIREADETAQLLLTTRSRVIEIALNHFHQRQLRRLAFKNANEQQP